MKASNLQVQVLVAKTKILSANSEKEKGSLPTPLGASRRKGVLLLLDDVRLQSRQRGGDFLLLFLWNLELR